MADQNQDAKQGTKFRKGQSGNPNGRPKKQRRDGWINEASGHGTTRDRRTLTTYGVDVITDLEAMQLWRSEWLCAKVIETRPEEAFRRGYEVKCDDKQLAEKIAAKAEELGLDAALVRAGQYQRAYGGAAIFPVLEGALGDFSEPLYESGIVDVKALHVLEPRQLQPVSYYTNLAHPKFGQPELWRFMPLFMGRSGGLGWVTIHESRLVIFPGIRVSMQTQPGQREGWGDSELSKPHAAIRDYGLSWGSATTILHNFGRDVLQFDGWAELASQDGGDTVMARRMAAFEMANSTLRVGVLDAKDKFTPRGGSLAGLDSVLIQQAQYVAAAVGMPVTVLMGMSPAGLNATGDMDVRNWYATIENDQETEYKPRVECLYKLLFLSTAGPTGGKEPPVWSVEFRKLLTPSAKEQAEERKLNAETDEKYADMDPTIVDDIIESRFGGDTYSAETVIDWPRREKAKKEAEEREAKLAEDAMLPRLPVEGAPGTAEGEGEPRDEPDDEPTA
jgi:phage-related protein (TIGR01555 family)